MARLTLEKIPAGRSGMVTMRIGGFRNGELSELKSMEHHEAHSKLLEMLDDRNDGVATTWFSGNGVYGSWFDNEYAYLNIGTSCD